jgi:tetratricopeptide (TPR) repeat protein
LAVDPGNADWQRNLGLALDRNGRIRLALGDRIGALEALEEALAVRRKLVAAEPANITWQQDLSFSLNELGDRRSEMNDFTGALTAYEESVAIRRKLVAADPGDPRQRRSLAVGMQGIGDTLMAAGDRAGALRAYEESLALVRKLVEAVGVSPNWQTDLPSALLALSTASEPTRAREALREAIAILERLERDNKLTPQQQGLSETVRRALAKLPPEQAEAQ